MKIILNTCFWTPALNIVVFNIKRSKTYFTRWEPFPNPSITGALAVELVPSIPWDLLCVAAGTSLTWKESLQTSSTKTIYSAAKSLALLQASPWCCKYDRGRRLRWAAVCLYSMRTNICSCQMSLYPIRKRKKYLRCAIFMLLGLLQSETFS